MYCPAWESCKYTIIFMIIIIQPSQKFSRQASLVEPPIWCHVHFRQRLKTKSLIKCNKCNHTGKALHHSYQQLNILKFFESSCNPMASSSYGVPSVSYISWPCFWEELSTIAVSNELLVSHLSTMNYAASVPNAPRKLPSSVISELSMDKSNA